MTGADNGTLAPSLQALAAQYLTNDDMSDWDRTVLEKASETGQISQADYDEGADNFEACLKDGGEHWVRTRLLNGVVEFQPPHGSYSEDELDNQVRVLGDCYRATYGYTQELFSLERANPGLLSNFSVAATNCLKNAGVVGDEFTPDDFDRAKSPGDSPGEKWPFDVTDPRARTCLYSLGYAIAVDAR